MRGQAEQLFLCRPPHHRLRRSFPPRGSLPLLSPPLCKGRWIAEGKTEGLSCPRDTNLYNPPASLRSAPSLAQGGQDKRAINTRASKIAFCASAPHLRIPARVAARRVLRAFGTAERRAFYACRSFFAKIFSNENILAISYNDVAKGITSSPQTAFYFIFGKPKIKISSVAAPLSKIFILKILESFFPFAPLFAAHAAYGER